MWISNKNSTKFNQIDKKKPENLMILSNFYLNNSKQIFYIYLFNVIDVNRQKIVCQLKITQHRTKSESGECNGEVNDV